MRVLVIGLDGVCQTVLDSMIEGGDVPTLKRVRDNSAVGPLESQLPPWTPSAWPSIYTGVNPGKHGVFGFLNFEGYDWDVVNRSHVKEFAVWELLSMHGFSSVVLNVPTTYPPREFDGVLVPGYLAPEEPLCHPPHVWTELNRELGDYSIYANTLDSTSSDEALADDLVRLTRMRGDAFRHLLGEHNPDFGFVQFQSTDTVFHQFPNDDGVIRRIYSAVDNEVSSILSECDPDMVLIVSDHGIGPMEGCEFRVNDYLYENGYLVKTTSGGGMPSWKAIARHGSESDQLTITAGSFAATVLEQAARVGLTSQRIGAVMRYFGLEDWILKTVPVDLVRAGTEQVDFVTSTAYMRERTEMGVRINLEGREPDGVVPIDEYERVRDELIGKLEQVKTQDRDPIFEVVRRREDIFDGPYLDDAPDVIAVPNRFDHFLVSTLKGAPIGEPTEPWEHKREGLIMVTGGGVDTTIELGDAHIFDITPTILASFGLPFGKRMDGSPLPVVEPTERTEIPPFDRTKAVTIDDSAIMDRLSDLGYLE